MKVIVTDYCGQRQPGCELVDHARSAMTPSPYSVDGRLETLNAETEMADKGVLSLDEINIVLGTGDRLRAAP